MALLRLTTSLKYVLRALGSYKCTAGSLGACSCTGALTGSSCGTAALDNEPQICYVMRFRQLSSALQGAQEHAAAPERSQEAPAALLRLTTSLKHVTLCALGSY